MEGALARESFEIVQRAVYCNIIENRKITHTHAYIDTHTHIYVLNSQLLSCIYFTDPNPSCDLIAERSRPVRQIIVSSRNIRVTCAFRGAC